MITYEEIRKNEDIRTYIQSADEALAALGFTEHSFAHVTKVAESVKYILETLGFSAHEVELGMIAAYLHDIGNLVNRAEHSERRGDGVPYSGQDGYACGGYCDDCSRHRQP